MNSNEIMVEAFNALKSPTIEICYTAKDGKKSKRKAVVVEVDNTGVLILDKEKFTIRKLNFSGIEKFNMV